MTSRVRIWRAIHSTFPSKNEAASGARRQLSPTAQFIRQICASEETKISRVSLTTVGVAAEKAPTTSFSSRTAPQRMIIGLVADSKLRT